VLLCRRVSPLLTADGPAPRPDFAVRSGPCRVDAFGQIAGGPPIGLVGTWFSLRAAPVAAGLLLLPALALFARAHGQERAAPAEPVMEV